MARKGSNDVISRQNLRLVNNKPLLYYIVKTALNFKHADVMVSTDSEEIRELSLLIQSIVGYKGIIKFDETHPDGTPQKILDISKIISLGWEPKTSLRKGIEDVYEWYKLNKDI